MSRKTILFLSLLGSFILAFGLYHVHEVSDITEGGTLGALLLAEHWLGISPAWSAVALNGGCYLLGIRVLGRKFLTCSVLSGVGFSLFYRIFEEFPPLWPELVNHPLAAAVLGAVFVGVGVGLCVRAGGAPSGDDALAMSVNALWGIPIERVYLVTDLTVLLLSLSYLSWQRVGYSLITVVLSGQIIGWLQKHSASKEPEIP